MKLSFFKKFILLLSFFIIVLVAVQNKFSAFNAVEPIKKYIFVSEKETIEKVYKSLIDIHIEGVNKEEVVAGDRQDLFSLPEEIRRTHIAIGGGITSKGIKFLNKTNFYVKFSFFVDFLPSFCKTASPSFHYNFYFAFDKNDETLMKLLSPFHDAFSRKSHSSSCNHLSLSLHLIKCSHNKRPAWAQNDAMMEAYLDGNEYFYRINDDSKLYSNNWTHIYLEYLSSFTPPNIGVVGPNHIGGNTDILTYDFVHRNHINIFGFYYPRLFTDWWADDWITSVYRPHHMKKIQSVYLKHTQTLGRRYNPDYMVSHHVANQIRIDQLLLHRYIKAASEPPTSSKVTKVISMSLYGDDPDLHIGVIRCAQLRLVYFPEWKLRVYTVKSDDDNNNNKTNNSINNNDNNSSHFIHSSFEDIHNKDDDEGVRNKLDSDNNHLFDAFNTTSIATTTTIITVNNSNNNNNTIYVINVNSSSKNDASPHRDVDDNEKGFVGKMPVKENSTVSNNHTKINNTNNNYDNKENNRIKLNLSVPKRILQSLELLGTEIVYISDSQSKLFPPDTWPYLVADDETVDYFEIRDGRFRLNKRDAMISDDFIVRSSRVNSLCDGVSDGDFGSLNDKSTNNSNDEENNKNNNNKLNSNMDNNNNSESSTKTCPRIAFHCIRDMHSDRDKPVVAGLWGGVAKEVRALLGGNPLQYYLSSYFSQNDKNRTLNNSQYDIIKSVDNIKLIEENTTIDDVDEGKKIINTENFLKEVLWNNFRQNFMCHDSVSCDKWRPISTSDFKMASFSSKSITDILGLKFNRFQIPSDPQWPQEVKKKFAKNTKCTFNSP